MEKQTMKVMCQGEIKIVLTEVKTCRGDFFFIAEDGEEAFNVKYCTPVPRNIHENQEILKGATDAK